MSENSNFRVLQNMWKENAFCDDKKITFYELPRVIGSAVELMTDLGN